MILLILNIFSPEIIGLLIFIVLSLIIFRLLITIAKKDAYITSLQNQYTIKINNIRDEHLITLENIRREMLNKEDERMRQWSESEREILQVLNGLSQVLNLKDEITDKENSDIQNKLNEIENLIKNGQN